MSEEPEWAKHLRSSLDTPSNPIICTLATSGEDGVPRARAVAFRGFLPGPGPEPLLFITTDIRHPKSHQLYFGQLKESPNCELCWWMAPINTQYRIVARGYMLPNPTHAWTTQFPASQLNPSINWEGERLKAFDKLSPETRASFCRPMPGTQLESYEDLLKWPSTLPRRDEAQDDKDRHNIEVALQNFSLVVFRPVEVDLIELGQIPHKRTIYKVAEGAWTQQIVVP